MKSCLGFVTCLLLLGCNDNGNIAFLDSGPPDAGIDTQCGPNLRPYKTACIPMLDDCPENHVAVPGGGCKRVGVEQCEIDGIPGIRGPPDWTCKRVGVVECEGGLRGPPDWTCKPIASGTCPGGLKIGSTCEPIGPPRASCLPGWAVTNRDGWCEPILSQQECNGTTMAKIGHATCQPVGECGSGVWGKIVVTPATVWVDAGSENGDGSQAHPFATIEEALSVVKAGGHIALAAGTYAGNVEIDKAVTLEGRCAAQVLVQGTGDPAAVTVKAKGVVLRGLSVTAETAGVELKNGGELRLQQVVVRDCSYGGIGAMSGELTVQDSLVADNVGIGISVEDTRLVLAASQVRGTTSTAAHKGGAGLVVSSIAGKAHVELRDSVLSTNTAAGVALYGVTGDIQRTVVRDTQVSPVAGSAGVGIQIGPDTDASGTSGATPSVVALRDSLLADNRNAGLVVVGSQVTADRAVIRDNQEDDDPKYSDFGAIVQRTDMLAATLTLRDSAVARSGMNGAATIGAALAVERSVVRDTRPRKSDGGYGFGLYAASHSGTRATLTMSRALVERNHAYGLYAMGTDALFDESIVRHTATDLSTGGMGGGLMFASHPQDNEGCSAVLKRSTVSGNAGAAKGTSGVAVFCARSKLQATDTIVAGNAQDALFIVGASVSIDRSIVRDTRETEMGTWGRGVVVAHDRQGSAGSLVLRDSLIAHNHRGIEVSGATATIERSMIRDNVPATVLSGRGLLASCWEGKAARVDLRDSVLQGNTYGGVIIAGASVAMERTVVSGTRPHPVLADGRGVYVGPDPDDASFRANLCLTDCLVAENHFIGVSGSGSDVVLTRTIVRETRNAPINDAQGQALGPAVGNGVVLTGATSGGPRPTVSLKECYVARNHQVGVQLVSAQGEMKCCRVVDTRPRTDGRRGDGVLVGDGVFVVEDSQIVGNRVAGLSSASATTRVRRCFVSRTAKGHAMEDAQNAEVLHGFGDGVTVGKWSGMERGDVALEDCLVEDSARGGLFFGSSSGGVYRSVVRRGVLAVSLADEATIDIAPDNIFEDNTENRVSYGEGMSGLAPLEVPPAPQSPGM